MPDSSWRCGDLTIDPIDRNAARLLELSARFRIGAPAAFSETTRAAAADGGAGGGDTGAVAAAAAAAAASAASPQAGFFHVVRFVMRLPQNVRPLPGSVRCTQFLAMSSSGLGGSITFGFFARGVAFFAPPLPLPPLALDDCSCDSGSLGSRKHSGFLNVVRLVTLLP